MDSNNDLYEFIKDGTQFILEQISDNVIDFYSEISRAYTVDTENNIYYIYRFNGKSCRNYVDKGHFRKKIYNIKSENNIYNKI